MSSFAWICHDGSYMFSFLLPLHPPRAHSYPKPGDHLEKSLSKSFHFHQRRKTLHGLEGSTSGIGKAFLKGQEADDLDLGAIWSLLQLLNSNISV